MHDDMENRDDPQRDKKQMDQKKYWRDENKILWKEIVKYFR